MKTANSGTSLPPLPSNEIKNGAKLFGDDLAAEGLEIWFAQEKEAFYEDNDGNSEIDHWYTYMRYINERLGFSQVRNVGSGSILVIGPGSGIEVDNFLSVNKNWKVSFLEASDNFKKELKARFSNSVVLDPEISGKINMHSNSVDLICAFSVLHHIPNVSYVMGELSRVLKPGGKVLVREPCSSMGDWGYVRSATPNERGIPKRLLCEIGAKHGLKIANSPVPIAFAPLNTFMGTFLKKIKLPVQLVYVVDRMISKLLCLNDHYWRDSFRKKMGPSAYFYVFKKPL